MGKGTGLGLSVSYGIIHDMKGTIEADNIEEGTRFTISLPAHAHLS
jgi:C4-dicarboxylate-specific signal transduction histidine kinase